MMIRLFRYVGFMFCLARTDVFTSGDQTLGFLSGSDMLFFSLYSYYPSMKRCSSNFHILCFLSTQHFISRELGEDFDFANYNQLVSKVLTNPKYADLFGISS
mmetsp:Transcript_42150/g.73940  ORF Transcript_42150/g.73940 Transcript_42150/m.73940 type:complete len:102 (-) Transcript_42150:354-659(-)